MRRCSLYHIVWLWPMISSDWCQPSKKMLSLANTFHMAVDEYIYIYTHISRQSTILITYIHLPFMQLCACLCVYVFKSA